MHYTIPVSLRCYEVLMQGIPGFGPPGQPLRYYAKLTKCESCLYCKSGKCRLDRCPYIEEKVMAGTATLRQIMDEVMIHIRHPPFLRRLEHYIKECEDTQTRCQPSMQAYTKESNAVRRSKIRSQASVNPS